MANLLLAIIYIAFISLGLPDALLGAAWPTIYPAFGVPVSYMGILSMTISTGTVISSLLADRLTRRFGTGRVTAGSVGLTALALLGFSSCRSFPAMLFWAIPYGIGAGGVDAALNNYVAVHYASRHMSWLHCMWGLGACTGPVVMGYALTGGMSWNAGYGWIGLFQVGLTAALLLSLPVWKRSSAAHEEKAPKAPLRFREVVSIPGAKAVLAAFFAYCALEQTAGQWASSYLVMKDGIPAAEAAGLAGLFYFGITGGRALSGFMTLRFSDRQMIRIGQAGIALGLVLMLLPMGKYMSMAGLVLLGLGCAPIYPCVIHSTPAHFGAERSQAVIGMQMASAYIGCLLMPPLFGIFARYAGGGTLPWYLLAFLMVMVGMMEKVNRACPEQSGEKT